MLIVVLLISLAILAVALFWPKGIPAMAWPVLLLYPHGWWEIYNPLPMKIGYDDIFLVFTGIVAYFRIVIPSGRPMRVGWAGRMLLYMLVMIAVSNIAGYIRVRHPEILVVALREVLKTVGYLLFLWCLYVTIENEKDIFRSLTALLVSLCLADVILILIGLTNSTLLISVFEVKGVLASGRVLARPGGPFGNANGAAMITVCGMGFLLARLKYSPSILGKLVLSAMGAVMVLAIAMTESRTGAIGLGVLLIVAIATKGLRVWGLAAVVGIAMFLVVSPDYSAGIFTRLDTAMLSLSSPDALGSRVSIWLAYLYTIDPVVLLFGQGMTAALIRVGRVGQLPHNMPLAYLAYFGIWGALWLLALFIGVLRRIRDLRFIPEGGLRAFRAGFLAMLFAFGAMSMTLEHSPASVRFVMLLSLVLMLEKGHLIALNRILTEELPAQYVEVPG